jgi:hypothetical protein
MRRHRRAFASAFQGLPREFAEGPLVIGFHDAMEGLLQGLEAAGADLSNGRARLRAELASVRFEVPAGPVRLDRNRQAVRRTYIQRIARTAAGKPALRLVRVVRGSSRPSAACSPRHRRRDRGASPADVTRRRPGRGSQRPPAPIVHVNLVSLDRGASPPGRSPRRTSNVG